MGNGQIEDFEEDQHEMEKGAVLELIAVPDEGHVFHAWIGVEERYEKENSLLMNEDKDVLLRFTEEQFNLEILDNYWENGDFVLEYEITNISEEDREIAEKLKVFNEKNEIVYYTLNLVLLI